MGCVELSNDFFFFVTFLMVKFENRPYGQSSSFDALASQAKKKPFLFFGLPFLTIMVAGSFGLSQLTQTKFDHRDRRHTKVIDSNL